LKYETALELCLTMITEHRTLLELTRIVAGTAENNQHILFPSVMLRLIFKMYRKLLEFCSQIQTHSMMELE